MDASQLSLFLTARLQSSSRTTLQLNDASNGADKVFADLLKKHAEEQSEQERQTELDRQNWRNQPPSYTPSRAPSTSSASSSYSTPTDNSTRSTSSNASSSSPPAKTTAHQAASSKSGNSNASQQGNATQSATEDHDTTTAAHKPDKTKDAAGTDDSQAADGQAVPANADGQMTGKHHVASDQGSDGENAPGNGQNQGQSGQDNNQKPQQQADGTAVATGIEGAILAGLMTGQPAVAVPAGSQVTSGGLQAVGNISNAAGMGLPGTIGTTGQGNTAAQNAIAAAAAQANAALAGSLSGTATAAASGATQSTANIAANEGLPQGAASTAATGTANRPSPQDLAAAFSSMINKTETQTTTNSGAARLSITKTDSAPQMPKPLVKVDTDNTSISSWELKAPTNETDGASETVTSTLDSSLAANDDGSDDFRSFSSYSPLLAGGSGPVVIGKQVDPLVALRQQLANASVQDQIAVHMQRAVKESVDKISIQLSPTELGQIHVKMKVDDDKNVTATITVERPSTLDLLQRDTKTLERALQEAGLKTDTGSLSFSLQRGNQGDSSDTPGWGRGNGRVGSSGQENSAGTAEISAATAGNEVDTANGLVNVAV